MGIGAMSQDSKAQSAGKTKWEGNKLRSGSPSIKYCCWSFWWMLLAKITSAVAHIDSILLSSAATGCACQIPKPCHFWWSIWKIKKIEQVHPKQIGNNGQLHAVNILDLWQSMCNGDCCPIFCCVIQSLLHDLLRGCIERWSGLY